MPPPSVCRLCVSKCLNFKKLYSENGQCSYENDLTQKYLNSTILNMEMAKHLTVICSQCWHHVLDFHNFQQCVILAQKKLQTEFGQAKSLTNVVAKQEDCPHVSDSKPIIVEDEDESPGVSVMEQNHVQPIELEDSTISETNNNNVTHIFSDDSNDPLTVFLGFDLRKENELELIDVPSSDSNHSSDIEMVITPNTQETLNIQTDQSHDDTRTTQRHNTAASKRNIIDPNYSNSYQRISNNELDELVYEFMPNLKCMGCPQAFTSFTLMRSHFRKKHPKLNFYIRCCNVKLKNRGCVEGHFRNHKTPRYFKCDYCDKSYSLKKYLNVHTMNCHPEIRAARTHKCPNCQKDFALQFFMKQHLESCNGENTANSIEEPSEQAPGTSSQFYQGEDGEYECNICEKVCRNIVSLRKHTWYHHRAEQKLKCSICDMKFAQRITWREHMAIQHTGEHLYACPNCPKTFLRRSWLLTHQKDLHGIKSARSCCTPPHRCPLHKQAENNTNANSAHKRETI